MEKKTPQALRKEKKKKAAHDKQIDAIFQKLYAEDIDRDQFSKELGEIEHLPGVIPQNEELSERWVKSFPGGREKLDSFKKFDDQTVKGVYIRYSLKKCDEPDVKAWCIRFLEADPTFISSGYFKERILQALKRSHLSNIEIQRLHAVILMMVDKCNRREFRYYCKLARVICTPDLVIELYRRLSSVDPNTRKRAKWVLEAITNKQLLPSDLNPGIWKKIKWIFCIIRNELLGFLGVAL